MAETWNAGNPKVTNNVTSDIADIEENLDYLIHRFGYRVSNSGDQDQGAAGSTAHPTIKDIVDGLSSATDYAVIFFPHTMKDGATTKYSLDTSIDCSSNTNLYFYFQPGAYLDQVTGDETLTLPSLNNVIASYNSKIFDGDMIDGGGKGSVKWWGTDATAFNAAFAEDDRWIHIPAGSYSIDDIITLHNNVKITFDPDTSITQTGTDKNIFYATSMATIHIDGTGGALIGKDVTEQLTNRGIIHFTECSDVRIENLEVKTGFDLIWVSNSDRVWIQNNNVHYFQRHGIVTGESTDIHVDHNTIYDCQETGANNAYGIQSTGDNAGGDAQVRCSIIGNTITNIKSWDGIMTHDTNDIDISHNVITDVRTGIDVGHSGSTNVVENIRIIGNYLEGTSTDTFGGASAQNNGIAIVGTSSTSVENVVISGNEITNFGDSAMTASTPGGIRISNVTNCTVTGNNIYDCDRGVAAVEGGIIITGNIDTLNIIGNTLRDATSLLVCLYNVTPCRGMNISGNVLTKTDNSVIKGIKIDSVAAIHSTIRNNTFNGFSQNDWIQKAGSQFNTVMPFTSPYDWADGTPEDMIAPQGALSEEISDRRFPYINTLYVKTAMKTAGVATDTQIDVDSTSGMSANDQIYVLLDNDRLHKSTIASVDDADTLTMNDALPSGAAIDQEVYVVRWVRSQKTGTFTMDAAASKVISDTVVDSIHSRIFLMPHNAAAATLMAGASSLYISARTHNTSFTVATADGNNAAGTETFYYTIYNGAD